MATFTFSVNKPVQKTANNQKTTHKPSIPQKLKVDLKYHEKTNHEPEYYSYINNEGQKCKYSGIVTRDIDGSYVGKTITTHKVMLQYHPTVVSVEPVDEYFSYIDNNGIERIFIGKPEFDAQSNTYFGNVTEEHLHDETISIFKDK